eukprot:4667627-Ditylum_brightwellii.AAC.2
MSGPLHRMVVLNFWTVWNEASSGSVAHVLSVAWNHVIQAGPAMEIWNRPSLRAHTWFVDLA